MAKLLFLDIKIPSSSEIVKRVLFYTFLVGVKFQDCLKQAAAKRIVGIPCRLLFPDELEVSGWQPLYINVWTITIFLTN